MTEHSVYNHENAYPVPQAPAGWLPKVRHLAQAPDAASPARLDRTGHWSVPRFQRVPEAEWAFRTVRGTADLSNLSPLPLQRGERIHLKADPTPEAAQKSRHPLARFSMTDPRMMRPAAEAVAPSRRMSAFDLYTSHFGMRQRPFSLVPDPDFLFWSKSHRAAYAMLEYGLVNRAPITLITGEIGAGKTTLLHALMRTVGPDMRIGLVSHTHASPGEMLRWVMLSLGQNTDPGASYPDLLSAFQTYVIAEYALGRRVVLVFDEAQTLARDTLEELRILTNLNSGKDDLLQLVFVGQPELREMIQRPDMHQLAQRVAASYHLGAMDAVTVRDYVAHRLEVAGSAGPLFSRPALDLIHKATGGIPRGVNQLCDLALVYAYTTGQKSVVRMTVQQVLEDGMFFGAQPENSALMAAE